MNRGIAVVAQHHAGVWPMSISSVLLMVLFSVVGCVGPSRWIQHSGRTAISRVSFVAFDIETTGLSPTRDRIVEIGAVRFRDGKVLARASWLVNPGMPIPESARRVHGISDEMVRNSKEFRDVFPEFRAFIGGSVLLAHNAARFDARFLSEELARSSIDAPSNEIVDTLALFREWFPEAKRHSLDAVASHVGVRIDGRHRALGDARCLCEVFCRGMAKLSSDAAVGDLFVVKGAMVHFR